MVRHIVLWNHKDEFTPEQRRANAEKVKTELEAAAAKIGGIAAFTVIIDALPPGSDRDVILNSLFESEEALQTYQEHPEHKKAGAFVRSVMTNRACIDYHEQG